MRSMAQGVRKASQEAAGFVAARETVTFPGRHGGSDREDRKAQGPAPANPQAEPGLLFACLLWRCTFVSAHRLLFQARKEADKVWRKELLLYEPLLRPV